MDEEMEGIEDIESSRVTSNGTRVGRRASNPGGARPNSGPKPAIKKIEARLQKKLEATFWVDMCEKYADPFIESVFDEGTPWEVRFKVWQEINNRALGKPKETINQNISGIGSLTELFQHATSKPKPPAV